MASRKTKDKVTIIEIAAEAGISKSTVSLVLKGSDAVHPETRERVNAAIRKLGYVYNRGAANLRQARSNIVGMVINDLTNPFFAELAVGIERSFQAARNSDSSSRRCRITSVPRVGLSMVSRSYSPVPSDDQRTPSFAGRPARRDSTVMRSATMKPE